MVALGASMARRCTHVLPPSSSQAEQHVLVQNSRTNPNPAHPMYAASVAFRLCCAACISAACAAACCARAMLSSIWSSLGSGKNRMVHGCT